MDDEKRDKIIQISERLENYYLEDRELQCKRDRLKKNISHLEEQLEVLIGKRKPRDPSSFSGI